MRAYRTVQIIKDWQLTMQMRVIIKLMLNGGGETNCSQSIKYKSAEKTARQKALTFCLVRCIILSKQSSTYAFARRAYFAYSMRLKLWVLPMPLLW